MPRWKLDVSRLYLAVEAVRRYQQITAADFAAKVGVPASTLTRLKQGQGPDVNAFLSLVAFIHGDPMQFVVHADGAPLAQEDGVQVDRREVMLVCSWAREALACLPAHLQPSGEQRESVMRAISHLYEEAGQGVEAEAAPREEEMRREGGQGGCEVNGFR